MSNDVRIEVKITGGEAEAFHVAPGGARTRIRGFFNMDTRQCGPRRRTTPIVAVRR